ncbi:MAG TPA: YeeE/YedE family protein, partial [Gammaproteobacteria bacterium]|nr:YeeE/YedE family protein [Gammaproteobacteria bacterium]
MESAPIWYVILSGFSLAVILGIVVHKTNFCTMGSISDWVNMGDKGRIYAWLLAIAVAMSGVLLLEELGVISLGMTMPPYRTANFAWLRYLLGGLMFGVGMTLAGGCVNKTLIRIGGGNMKSLFVLLVGGIMAFLMTRTDFYHYAFHIWMDPLTINLQRFGIDNQQITTLVGSLFGVVDSGWFHILATAFIILGLLFFIFRSRHFRSRFDNFLGGAGVGLLVVAGWYVTAGPLGQAAVEAASFMDNPPQGVGAMSFTFVNPMGETLYYLVHPLDITLITFGVAILVGVIVGSFLYGLFTGNLRLEWFTSKKDF